MLKAQNQQNANVPGAESETDSSTSLCEQARKYMKRVRISAPLLAAVFLLAVVPAATQSSREVLTNGKVIELIKLGLSEPLIVQKIRTSDCQCDTTTAGLGKLKAAKVSDAIIMAMMESSGLGHSDSPSPPKSTAPAAEAATPLAGPAELNQITEPGIYYYNEGKMHGIDPTVFAGSSMNTWKSSMTFGLKKAKYKAKVMNNAANLHINQSDPVFYFVFNPDIRTAGANMAGFWGMPATSPNEFILVQMDIQKNSRQAVLGEYGTFSGMDMGARDKDVRPHSFEKLRPGVYKVTPKQPLTPGQYSFYYAANVTGLGFAGGKVFDFGVK